ncbi:GAF domain-containing protein [Leifsonia sp. ZF2019]|uniref:GAF domain-containing sensor histidine kinase n=1 Tax=Leifsonia sp. ZF2019 TaxID=2781978 RepID=UPI001CBB2C49|nr:GAF domain-containing protein [Leifsonia sp. ZF2019]UAJ77819.1 GAF domain-containing protein [Leifsonia sp. ZF2019]
MLHDDEPITFPDAPRAELDRALSDLLDQARKVLATQGRLRTLVQANRAVVSHLELPAVLRTIVESAVELVGARYGALGVIAESGGLEQFIHVGMNAADVDRIGHLPEGHGLLGALIDDPRPIRIEAIAEDPRSAAFPPGHPPMSAFLGVPITVRGTVYGNLYLTDPVSGGFSEDDEQLVRDLAASAGLAIDNARLFADSAARQSWSAAAADLTGGILGSDPAQAREEFVTHLRRLLAARVVAVLPNARLDDARLRGVVEGGQATRVDELTDFPTDGDWSPGPALLIPYDGTVGRPGLLVVLRASGDAAFTASELERAVAFTRQIEVASELAAARADQERMVVLEDRTRIARDLHDHVIQQLFGTGLELQSILSALDAGSLAARLETSIASLDEAITQIRTIIFALSAQGNHPDSLRHRILDTVEQVGGPWSGSATVSFSGPVDLIVDADEGDDIIAYVREGLTNVVRHSGAESAAVTVIATADAITVDVVDDGHGIGDVSRRSGLRNLVERAERCGGRLDIRSGPNGTALRLRLPLPSEGGNR